MALSSERVAEARRAIHQHLAKADVYSSIRAILATHAADHSDFDPNDTDQVMRVLKEQGVVKQLLGEVDANVTEAVSSTASTTRPSNQRVLHVRVNGGRAFLDHFDTASSDRNSLKEFLSVHIHFGDQRLRSARVPAGCDPAFDDDFVLRLRSSIRDIIEDETPLHIAVICEDGSSVRSRVVGENVVEWRRVLRTGTLTLAVELAGMNPGVPAGIVDLHLDLMPLGQRRSEEEISFFVEQTHQNLTAADREFLVFARRWWAELHSASPHVAKRPVKVFAPTSSGRMLPVTHFVEPIPQEREFDGPEHMARFVALLGVDSPAEDAEHGVLGGGRPGPGEQWLAPFIFLAQRRGDSPNHALLLCSMLLGAGLDAWCLVVHDESDRTTTVVITRRATAATALEDVTLWLPAVGKRLAWRDAAAVGIKSVGCAFSNTRFFANVQETGVEAMIFDFDDDLKWKDMNSLKLRLVPKRTAPPLLWVPVNGRQLELDLEARLRDVILQHRDRMSAPTHWDDDLGSVLTGALAQYEAAARSGNDVLMQYFQDSVRGKIGAGRSFKGFPINVTHTNEKRILSAAMTNGVGQAILDATFDDTAHAVRVRVFVFPERVLSVWVMFAARYRAL